MPKPLILVIASLILKYMGGFMQKNGKKLSVSIFNFGLKLFLCSE